MAKDGRLVGVWIVIPILAAAAWVIAIPLESVSPTLVWPVRNFSFFFLLCMLLYRRVIWKHLHAYKIQIEQSLQKNQIELSHAEQELTAMEVRLSNIAGEKRAIRDRFTEEGKRMAEQAILNARRTAQRVEGDLERQVDSETSQVRAEIRAKVLQQATEIARKKIGSTLTDSDDRNLRQSALQSLFE